MSTPVTIIGAGLGGLVVGAAQPCEVKGTWPLARAHRHLAAWGVNRWQCRAGQKSVLPRFYDVSKDTVEILAIIEKALADDWLKKHGER